MHIQGDSAGNNRQAILASKQLKSHESINSSEWPDRCLVKKNLHK
jgi:hypothetical protein